MKRHASELRSFRYEITKTIRACVRTTLRATSFSIIPLLLMSCTSFSMLETAQQSVDVNKAVGSAEDRVTLLNIVRSYLRRPRVYTDFGAFTEGAPTSSSTLTLSQTPSIASTLSSGTTSFKLSPETQQGFIRAITSPVPATTIEYYSKQDWFNSELLHMFVREIKVYDSNGHLLHDYSNYPQDTQAYDQFDAIINGLSACDLSLKNGNPSPSSLSDTIGPKIDLKEADQAEHQIDAAKSGLEMVPYPSGKKSSSSAVSHPDGAFSLIQKRSRPNVFKLIPRGNEVSVKTCLAGFATANVPPPSDTSAQADVRALIAKLKAEYKGRHIEFVIRSPDAIIYYLGEVARVQLDGDYPNIDLTKNAASRARRRRGIGVVHYTEGCFYDPIAHNEPPGNYCYAVCRPFFVLHKQSEAEPYPPTYCSIPKVIKCGQNQVSKLKTGVSDMADDKEEDFKKSRRCAAWTAKINNQTSPSNQVWTPHIVVLDTALPYRSEKYDVSLAYDDGTETLHVLSLLEQLVGLQTSSTTEAPGNSQIEVEP